MPVGGDRPIEGTVTLSKVDAAELSAGAPESWKLTGHADGQGRFRYAPGEQGRDQKTLPLEAEAHLTAPDLKVGGVAARSLDMTMTIHQGNPKFDVRRRGPGRQDPPHRRRAPGCRRQG